MNFSLLAWAKFPKLNFFLVKRHAFQNITFFMIVEISHVPYWHFGKYRKAIRRLEKLLVSVTEITNKL